MVLVPELLAGLVLSNDGLPKPGLLVFLSLPLTFGKGIAIASGVPPVLGLVTAIVGGIVIGIFAGSPIQFSGPSAGLAVMGLEVVTGHGLEALAVIVVIMGVLQTASGLLRLGQLFRAVSPAVINGMPAGIGVLILSAQFHVMVDDAPRATGLEYLFSIPDSIYKGIAGDIAHRWAAFNGVLTLLILVGLPAIKKSSLSRLPAPLAAVIVASFIAWICNAPIQRVDMPDSLLAALTFPSGETLKLLEEPGVWGRRLRWLSSPVPRHCCAPMPSMRCMKALARTMTVSCWPRASIIPSAAFWVRSPPPASSRGARPTFRPVLLAGNLHSWSVDACCRCCCCSPRRWK